MTSEKIEVNYEALQKIADQFSQETDHLRKVQEKISAACDNLRRANWIGQGANMFFREYEGELTPALSRLAEGLNASRQITLEIYRIFADAEEMASKPFSQIGEEAKSFELVSAEKRLEEAKQKLDQADKELDAAFERANQSYNELKNTKGTEHLAEIEELVEKKWGIGFPFAMILEWQLAVARSALEEVGFDAFVDVLEKGSIKAFGEGTGGALGKTLQLLNLVKNAWDAGQGVAMDITLIVRRAVYEWQLWTDLVPDRIGYEFAASEYDQALADLEALKNIE
jgi:WXG100 family type VII secretion target